MNTYKAVEIGPFTNNLTKEELLKNISDKWSEADEFQASSFEEAAEVFAEQDLGMQDDEEMLIAVRDEEGKTRIIVAQGRAEIYIDTIPYRKGM